MQMELLDYEYSNYRQTKTVSAQIGVVGNGGIDQEILLRKAIVSLLTYFINYLD